MQVAILIASTFNMSIYYLSPSLPLLSLSLSSHLGAFDSISHVLSWSLLSPRESL